MSLKYDIFGGKPLSKVGDNKRTVLSNATIGQIITTMRSPPANVGQGLAHGQQLQQLYSVAVTNPNSKVKSYLNVVFTGAWKRVIEHFFTDKKVKIRSEDGFTTSRKDKIYTIKDRKGVTKNVKSIEYFKRRHPKLYNRYLKAYRILVEGGVAKKTESGHAYVHRSKFDKYTPTEQGAILGFISYAHYGGYTANSRSAAALQRNRDDRRYGGVRSEILKALASARKLSKNGKYSNTELKSIKDKAGNVVISIEENENSTVQKYAPFLQTVNIDDVFSSDRVKVSFKGTSKAEKDALKKAISAKKKAIIELLLTDKLYQTINNISATKKEKTALTKKENKYDGIRNVVRKLNEYLLPDALDRQNLQGLTDAQIFKRDYVDKLDHDAKTKLRKYANVVKLRVRSDGVDLENVRQMTIRQCMEHVSQIAQNYNTTQKIQGNRDGRVIREAQGGRSSRRNLEFDDEDFEESSFTGGSSSRSSRSSRSSASSGSSMSSFSVSTDNSSEDSVFGGGRKIGRKNKRDDSSYIWFV